VTEMIDAFVMRMSTNGSSTERCLQADFSAGTLECIMESG